MVMVMVVVVMTQGGPVGVGYCLCSLSVIRTG